MKTGVDLGRRIREYIEIVEFLKKREENDELHITDKYIYITREKLESLLEQYGKYDETLTKLKIWKKLQWIEADDNRITNQLRLGKKRVQRVKINRKIAETFLELGGRDYRENKEE